MPVLRCVAGSGAHGGGRVNNLPERSSDAASFRPEFGGAVDNAKAEFRCWSLAKKCRAVESDVAPNYRFVEGRLEKL
jgi:hypothetical protein